MVDSQKLTLTGQLLGSPAYMAPEMITGGRLDFRTDVFSLGILLYRLTVGELPFKGKNPHEVLKRIADAEYIRPIIANPRVGDQLSSIISRALSRDSEHRFPSVEALHQALQEHLADVGIETPEGTLRSALRDPDRWAQQVLPSLVERLIDRGRREMRRGQAAAAFSRLNRVLAIEPANATVLQLMSHLTRRQRLRTAGKLLSLALGITLATAFVVFGLSALRSERGDRPAPAIPSTQATRPPSGDAGYSTAPVGLGEDAEVPGQTIPEAGAPGAVVDGRVPPTHLVRPVGPGMEVVAHDRSFELKVLPPIWRVWVDGQLVGDGPGQPLRHPVGPGEHLFMFRSSVTYDHSVKILPDTPSGSLTARLKWRPARLRVRAEPPEARIQFKSPPYLEHLVSPRPGDVMAIPLPSDREPPFSARIMVYAERYQAEYRDITLVPNELTDLTVKLTPLK
jgi:eukaryotic-like serine/threonine-protein kinase